MSPLPVITSDAEKALCSWLRGLEFTALNPARIAVGLPDGDAPAISLHRIGGAADASEAPVDLPGMQLDVWGQAGTQASRAECRAAADELRAAMSLLTAGATRLDELTVASGAELLSDLWLPEGDRPRYVLSYSLTTITIPQ